VTEPGHSAKRVRIYGRVQGVAYRAWAVGRARGLGLQGWVRNRSDGSVEALLLGPEKAVSEMIKACREGPRAARVQRVDVDAAGAAEEWPDQGFKQLPSL